MDIDIDITVLRITEREEVKARKSGETTTPATILIVGESKDGIKVTLRIPPDIGRPILAKASAEALEPILAELDEVIDSAKVAMMEDAENVAGEAREIIATIRKKANIPVRRKARTGGETRVAPQDAEGSQEKLPAE